MNRAVLPVDAALPEILDRLRDRRRLVLVAPPGSGKTTRLPPALLASGLLSAANPVVVVLQPRRVAARAVAARIASENGWRVGGLVGHHVRFDRAIGPETRLRIVTEGILNRQLVADPFLGGIGAVVLDEFHERSLETDLALALVREVADSVRDDLILVVMSATLDAGPIARFLGDAPIVRVEGRTFPVEVIHHEPSRAAMADRMAAAIEAAVLADPSDGPGHDLLAFLPGADEIRRTGQRLGSFADRHGLIVLPLHGSLTGDEQDRALRPADRRKVVLATNIAETSLTIDGVSTVVDSGLARVASYDPGRGIDRLDLVRISRASADQRAGRAGRTRPGRCVRLWSAREERGMPASDTAEVHRVDLAGTLLSLHAWGITDPAGFGWFEPPDPARVEAAERTLAILGAIEPGSNRITAIGRRLLEAPAPPRLARLLLEATRVGLVDRGASVAALLSERDVLIRTGPRPTGGLSIETSDLSARLDAVREAEADRFRPGLRDRGIDPIAARRVVQARDDFRRIARRWRPSAEPPAVPEDEALRKIVLVGFPDRVCLRRKGDPASGLMVGGRGIRLDPDSVVRDGELFLALDPREEARGPRVEARVRIAVRIEPEWLEELFPDAVDRTRSARFDVSRGRVVGLSRVDYRGLTLAEGPHAAVDPDLAARTLADAVRPGLLTLLAAHDQAGPWLARLDFVRRVVPEVTWPELDEEALDRLMDLSSRGRRSVDDLSRAPWLDYLRGHLGHALSRRMDDLAPETVTVPSGSRIRLVYEADRPPILAVRLQELFGRPDSPRIADGRVRVLLHLLGPNFRPVQITDDLRSFWKVTYAQVRKDLRNRYPRHAWPDDPLAAKPEAKGGRRG